MNTENEEEIRQLQTIAALYTKRCKLREAESVYQSILLIEEKHKGEFSPDLAVTCYHLAEIYAELGQYVLASPLYERAVRIWESLRALNLVKPEQTIFFMDALVALQTNNRFEQEERRKREHHRSVKGEAARPEASDLAGYPAAVGGAISALAVGCADSPSVNWHKRS